MPGKLLLLTVILATGLFGEVHAAGQAGSRAEIQRLVVAEARNIGVAADLALAVAQAESNFKPNVVSHKGARGVMQIMPRTAWEEYGITPDQLCQPRINVRLGLHFLKRLLRRYRGRLDLALSFYNGGSAVGDLPAARIIPATHSYVRKVQGLRLDYQRQVRLGSYK